MYYMYINKNFVHQVGDQPRSYYDARSIINQVNFLFSLKYVYVTVNKLHLTLCYLYNLKPAGYFGPMPYSAALRLWLYYLWAVGIRG
jgi:hypothetical protein